MAVFKRKAPQLREKKAQPKPVAESLQGRSVSIPGVGRASVIRPARRKGALVVRTSTTHPRQLSRMLQHQLDQLSAQADRLLKKRNLTNDEHTKLQNIFSQMNAIKNPKPTTIRRILSVSADEVTVKQKQTPKWNQVPKTQRRKSRRQSLMNALASSKIKNTKRRLRAFARKGLRPKRGV